MKKVNLISTTVAIIFLLQNILLAQVERFPDMKFYGEAPGNNFGFSSADAGDVNGDGYGDILVGAPYYNSNTGRAYIFFGGQNINDIPDIILNGQSAGNYFGKSVSAAGDVNEDGFKDILVSRIGSTYIYFGSNNFDTNPDLTLVGNNDPGPLANISDAGDVNNDGFSDVLIGVNNSDYAVIYYGGTNMDNTYDVYLQNGSGNFGFAVSLAGDFNKDGFYDVIIGEPEANASEGKAHIYFGSTNMDNTVDLVLNGELTGSIFGHTISDAGDVNGDGFGDLAVGAPYYSSLLGRTYIYFGGVSPDNIADVILPGELNNSHFGHTVSKAGDFNRDSYADIIVGSITYNSRGRIDIYYGGANMNVTPDLYMLGNNDQLGFSVTTAGDVNDDGKLDLLASARTNDDAGTDAGIVYLFLNPLNNFITSVTPSQNAINVNKSSDINIVFSQNMNASTINSSNIKVFGLQTGLKISSVNYNTGTRTATINPNSDFKVGEKIQVTLSSGIQTSTNTPITPFTWTFTVQALSGTAVFTEVPVVTSDINVSSFVSGDLDNDGDLDFITLNADSNNFSVYKNDHQANFTLTSTLQLNISSKSILGGDLDSDGDLDIAIAGNNELTIYKNNGNAVFSEYSNISGITGGTLTSFADAGDLDRDGDIDLFWGAISGNNFSFQQPMGFIFLNNGDGSYNFPQNITFGAGIPPCTGGRYPANLKEIKIIDFDNDGDLDVAASALQERYCLSQDIYYPFIRILFNNGNAQFSFPYNNLIELDSISPLTSENFDNDEDADIISNNLLLRNNDSGSFTSSSNGIDGSLLISSDFDADGDLDIAAAKNPNKLFFHKNSSNATFTVPTELNLDNNPRALESGDFDGDGDIDIAMVSGSGTDISILKNNLVPQTCSITGSEVILPGSTGNIFACSTINGYWDISNYDITQASIPPSSTGDTVSVSAGAYGGHFILYFLIPDDHGDYPLCSKHVYVEDSTAIVCNVTTIIEGFYDVNLNRLNIKDTVRAYLRNTNSPFGIVDSAKTVIDSTIFTGNFTFRNAPTGIYYIMLKHRNGLETWSKSGGESIIRGSVMNYDFTSSGSQAYGNNLIQKGSKFCSYSGDVNQDGVIDGSDGSLTDTDAQQFATGYRSTDLNGDGIVDGGDLLIVDNNSSNFITTRNPIVGDNPTPEQVKAWREGMSGNPTKSGNQDKSKITNDIPQKFELSDNYPNPFNPLTKIKFALPLESNVKLAVYDITGREISILVNERLRAGQFEYQWNASQFASGTYFYKITAGEFTQVKKMILTK